MTEQVENLILDYLRAMRSDIALIKEDIRELKLRVGSLEQHVANFVGDVLRMNARMDRFDGRFNASSGASSSSTDQNIQTSPAVIVM